MLFWMGIGVGQRKQPSLGCSLISVCINNVYNWWASSDKQMRVRGITLFKVCHETHSRINFILTSEGLQSKIVFHQKL